MHRPTERLGLYDPAYEHDSCGVAFVARLDGVASHETVRRALTALENLEHRGAAGADADSGDGAGILAQVPDRLFRDLVGADLPPAGAYGIGVCFLPQDEARRAEVEAIVARAVEAEGQRVVLWRDVPVDAAHVGAVAGAAAPCIRQVVVAASAELARDPDAFERKLYVIRRVAELEAGPELVVPSFSSRTVVYKGMLSAPQLGRFYLDLEDERFETALALVHSRYSTNTFPSWELAHPYRMLAHNGEINTLQGNVNWMRARESQLASELFGADLAKVLPVVRPGGSDSATFDNVLELLVLCRPLAAARDHDDGARGLRGPRRRLSRAGRLLRLPRLPDRGLGRAGRARLHGRARDRRDARPERAPAGALARDARRVGRSRLRDRRARRGARERASEGSAPARQALPRRPRAGADRGRRRGQARARDEAAVRRVVRTGGRAARRPAEARAGATGRGAASPPPARVRLLAGGHEDPARPARAQRRGGGRLDGQRPARCPCCPIASRSSTRTSSSSSPR